MPNNDSICDICGGIFSESDISRVTPAHYLGGAYPDITSFCPLCFQKFLVKAQSIYQQAATQKINTLKDFVNS